MRQTRTPLPSIRQMNLTPLRKPYCLAEVAGEDCEPAGSSSKRTLSPTAIFLNGYLRIPFPVLDGQGAFLSIFYILRFPLCLPYNHHVICSTSKQEDILRGAHEFSCKPQCLSVPIVFCCLGTPLGFYFQGVTPLFIYIFFKKREEREGHAYISAHTRCLVTRPLSPLCRRIA